MPRYRKLPVTIHAEQWNPMLDGCHWIPLPPVNSKYLVERRTWWEILTGKPANWYIRTLEGDMKISPNDWCIYGVNGEWYPCKPSIFERTYEPV